MELSKKAFKAYDIRGIVPQEVNAELAYRVGRVFAAMFAAESVVVGHDIRLTGPELAAAAIEGLRDGGCTVYDIGGQLLKGCATVAALCMTLASAARRWFILPRRI